MKYSFTLLGHPQVLQNNRPVDTFRTQKEVALLLFLAHTGEIQPRDLLARILWQKSAQKQRMTNLRTLIARLRKRVPDLLIVTRTTIALNTDLVDGVDSADNLTHLDKIGEVNSAESVEHLSSILKTLNKDFLQNFHIDDAPDYDNWVTAVRERIHRETVAGYQKLANYFTQIRDAANGLATAEAWLALDEWDETAQALQERFLGLETPSQHQTATATATATNGTTPPPITTQPTIPNKIPPIRHNLPAQYDRFFDRVTSQKYIHEKLNSTLCRFMTIVGQGGVGKTRLATHIAHQRLDKYVDGVWLVELAEIDPNDPDLAEAIAIEIATTLELRLTGNGTPEEQLLKFLRYRHMLLVLDNFDLIIDGAPIVKAIADQCANVQMLITSREVLGLRAEWVFDLAGLSYPLADDDDGHYDAVDLFTERMAQQQWNADMNTELRSVRAICRLVEGLPLAIELAASMTRYTSCEQLAAQIENNLGLLATTFRDVPRRHHNLRVVFDMSWERLSAELQTKLAQLSVFRGGFTADSAKEIAGAEESQLSALRDKSLATYNFGARRYSLHAMVRAFSAEKNPSPAQTQQRHANFYLDLLTQHKDALQKEAPQVAVGLIQPDLENVRQAWQTALEAEKSAPLLAALPSLSVVYQLCGLAFEAADVMHTSTAAILGWGVTGHTLAVRTSLEQARFLNRLGKATHAENAIKKIRPILETSADQWAQGMANILWAESLWRRGKFADAHDKLLKSKAIADELGNQMLIGWCHHHWGIINDIQGRLEQSLEHFQRAVVSWDLLGNVQAKIGSLLSISIVEQRRNDLASAQQHAEQALELAEQIGDTHRQTAILNSLAAILDLQGDYTGAYHYLEQALKLAITTSDQGLLTKIYLNIGRTFFFRGELSTALDYFQRSEVLAVLISDFHAQALIQTNIARLTLAQKQVEKTIALLKSSITIAREHQLLYIGFDALMMLAQIYTEHDKDQADTISQEALAFALQLDDQDKIIRAKSLINRPSYTVT